jgi:uncharacterized protein (DUF488 family)
MIYTIGYQGMKTADELIAALKERNIRYLLDVRSKPFGRNASFRKNHLETALPAAGIEYKWAGDRLGGFSEITEEAIKYLAEWQDGKIICLMCMEEDPDRCHRKTEISRRIERIEGYNISVTHIMSKIN